MIGSVRVRIKKHPEILVLMFFGAVLLLGLVIYRDFGMFIDDPNQKALGEYVFNYVFHGDPTYLQHPDRYYGVIFELLLTILARTFKLTSDHDIYFFRHLGVFLSFYAGLICLYFLIKKITSNWKLGLLGSLLLLISPRIFENAFYNSKDIPMMAASILAVYTLMLFQDKQSIRTLSMHALASALLIALRIPGVYILAITFLVFLIKLLNNDKTRHDRERYLWYLGGYILLSFCFTMLLWPALWSNPLGGILAAFINMSSFSYPGDVLFMGQYINSHHLPWYYIPVWIAVTTPLLYTVYFLLGLFYIFRDIIIKGFKSIGDHNLNHVILLGWFFIPLVAVIIFHSTLYNSWRHMFFIYPAFLVIALVGLSALYRSVQSHFSMRLVRLVIPVTLIASLIGTSINMVVNHPYESMYYTILAGRNMRSVRFRYEMDYSATCYREALEKILAEDKSPSIPILVTHLTGKRNAYLVPQEERDRLEFVGSAGMAKYFIGDYHNRREDYNLGAGVNPWYRVSIEGVDLCVVYRLHDE